MDVDFKYPTGPTILKNVNFGLDQSSRVCIVGPNGAGACRGRGRCRCRSLLQQYKEAFFFFAVVAVAVAVTVTAAGVITPFTKPCVSGLTQIRRPRAQHHSCARDFDLSEVSTGAPT